MIRMAFFADRPMMVIRPIWKYTSAVRPRMYTPISTPSTPSGTTRITASGIDQLSYSAASARNTARMAKAYRMMAWLPASFSSRDWPVHSMPKPWGSLAASASISAIAWPVLKPGAAAPSMRIDG